MSYRVEILTELRIGLVTGSGHLTGREIADACTAMVTDALWESGFDEVWDFTAAEVDVSPDELDQIVGLAHAYAAQIAENQCVFVTARESVQPLLLLFERLTADLRREYQTVPTLEEAAAWLGLAPGALGPGLATRAASGEEG